MWQEKNALCHQNSHFKPNGSHNVRAGNGHRYPPYPARASFPSLKLLFLIPTILIHVRSTSFRQDTTHLTRTFACCILEATSFISRKAVLLALRQSSKHFYSDFNWGNGHYGLQKNYSVLLLPLHAIVLTHVILSYIDRVKIIKYRSWLLFTRKNGGQTNDINVDQIIRSEPIYIS